MLPTLKRGLNLYHQFILPWLFGVVVIAALVSMAPNARSQERPSYKDQQDLPKANSAVYSVDDYVNETGGASFLGMTVRRERLELKSGKESRDF